MVLKITQQINQMFDIIQMIRVMKTRLSKNHRLDELFNKSLRYKNTILLPRPLYFLPKHNTTNLFKGKIENDVIEGNVIKNKNQFLRLKRTK